MTRLAITLVRAAAACTALVVSASAAAAQPASPTIELRVPARDLLRAATRPPVTPLLRTAGLTIEEALRLTLDHDPVLLLARQDLAAAEGRSREAHGLFDTVVALGPGGSYIHEPLDPFLRRLEVDRRNQMAAVAQVFSSLEAGVREALASNAPRPPFCPNFTTLTAASRGAPFDRRRQPDAQGFRFDPRLDVPGNFGIVNGLVIDTPFGDFRLEDLCRPPGPGEAPSSIFAELWRRLRTVGGYGLGAAIDAAQSVPTEFLGGVAELSEALGTRANLALERLGAVPEDEVRKGLFLEARAERPLRSGIRLGTTMRISSEELGFAGKSLDPAFGGRSIRTRFPSFVELRGDVPLRKGLGSVSATGMERAAGFTADAARETLRHQTAEELFRTVVAYIALATSEQRAAALRDSLARAENLSALGDKMVEAGEIPPVERGRVAGRVATVRLAVAQADASVIEARRTLVESMGVRIDSFANGPHALSAMPLPADVPIAAVESLMADARQLRRDPLAARRLRDAASALSAAARSDLKRTVSLNVRGGLSTFYESPFDRFYPDEQHPIGTPGESRSPVGVGSFGGYGRIFTGAWKPYVVVSLSFDLPLANRAARGRLEQAAASLTQSDISARELDLSIDRQVVGLHAAVRSAAEVLERRQQTLTLLGQSFDGTMQQFRIGDVTMLDLLITEESLTVGRLQEVSDLQVYATALARLRFEAGQLARYQQAGAAGEGLVIRPFK